MKRSAAFLLFSSALSLPILATGAEQAARARTISPVVARRGESLWAGASQGVRAFVDEEVRSGRGKALTEVALRNAVRARFGARSPGFENEVLFLVAWKTMGGINAELNARNAQTGRASSATNSNTSSGMKKQIVGSGKDVESQDKMGNFEIQSLMSEFNQAETLASSVQKKMNDTSNSVAGNLEGGGRAATPTPRLTKSVLKEGTAGRLQVVPAPTPR